MNLSDVRMGLRFIRLMIWRVLKRKWYLPNVPEITVDQLAERLEQDPPPILIDLRGRKEFEGHGTNKYDKHGHIRGAKWMPIMQLKSKLDDLPKEREYVTMCPGGGMSLVAVELMNKAGFENAKSLKGGIWAWAKKDYPFVKSDVTTEFLHEETASGAYEKKLPVEKSLALQTRYGTTFRYSSRGPEQSGGSGCGGCWRRPRRSRRRRPAPARS